MFIVTCLIFVINLLRYNGLEFLSFKEKKMFCSKTIVLCQVQGQKVLGLILLINKDLKKVKNERKFLFVQVDRMALKLKQKELRKEIIKCQGIYKKRRLRATLSTVLWEKHGAESRKSRKSNSLFPSNLDLNELNQFYARFDTFDLNNEIADERMELNLSENVDEWLVISENETRKEFFNVNANKTKVPDGLTGTFLKNICITTVSYFFSYIQPILIILTPSMPDSRKTSKIIPVPKKEKVTTINDQDLYL